jgi:hypothetical protein
MANPPYLFTIISLILAVSAANYIVTMGLRVLWQDGVKQADTLSRDFIVTIGRSAIEQNKRAGERHYNGVQCWIKVWNAAPTVSIGLFLLLVYTLVTLVVFGQVSDKATDVHWIFCRCSVGILAVVNLISAVLGWVAFRSIKSSLRELESSYQIARDIEQKIERPSAN